MYAVNWDLVDRLGLDRTALAGQTALVTGGARGIGEGAAMTMAALGARVVIVDKLPTGQDVADAIEASGGQARFIECDLSVVDEVMAMIPQAIDRLRPDRHPRQQRPARDGGPDRRASTWRTGTRRSRSMRARRS